MPPSCVFFYVDDQQKLSKWTQSPFSVIFIHFIHHHHSLSHPSISFQWFKMKNFEFHSEKIAILIWILKFYLSWVVGVDEKQFIWFSTELLFLPTIFNFVWDEKSINGENYFRRWCNKMMKSSLEKLETLSFMSPACLVVSPCCLANFHIKWCRQNQNEQQ